MAKQIAIQDLKPGMFIVGVIEQNGPVKIRKSGLVTSFEMVQGLQEMGVVSIAVDPERTVELEVDDEVHVSQTQFVMQANEEKASDDTDNHLAEQFNRSLFMPSLQKVPSVWQYYGAKVAMGVLVVVLGFASGWFVSAVPGMLQGGSLLAETVATTESEKVIPEAKALGQSSTEVAKVSDESKATHGAVAAADVSETELIETSTAEESPELTLFPEDAADNQLVLGAGSASQPNPNSFNDHSQLDNNASDTVSNATTAADSIVSPELLKRFEAAMADIERESSPEFADDGETFEYGDSNNAFNSTEVQRVDELPARIMTRLPRMSFSAHMYASNPRDRWVKVNGREMGEGQWLDDKIFLDKIEPQHVILLFEGHQFSMRALSEW